MNPQLTSRFKNAKRAFATRRVPAEEMHGLVYQDVTPKSGDLVLTRISELGHHKRIERIDGRRAHLYTGDEVILCYGNRYAPDQFEAQVPDSLQPCHMVAAGGIASEALCWHKRISGPTQIEPLGLITNAAGKVLNILDFALERSQAPLLDSHPVPCTAVVGTSMNAGKTTSAAHLIHGLEKAGYKVGAMKITGTGAGGDLWLMQDSGAYKVLDFTDAGYPTTFKVPIDEVLSVYETLSDELIKIGCDAIVVEIADGIYQPETRQILQSDNFRKRFNGVLFAAREAMGACSGAKWLQQEGYQVLGISGQICASPLAQREAAQALSLPVFDLEMLSCPEQAPNLLYLNPLLQPMKSVG